MRWNLIPSFIIMYVHHSKYTDVHSSFEDYFLGIAKESPHIASYYRTLKDLLFVNLCLKLRGYDCQQWWGAKTVYILPYFVDTQRYTNALCVSPVLLLMYRLANNGSTFYPRIILFRRLFCHFFSLKLICFWNVLHFRR